MLHDSGLRIADVVVVAFLSIHRLAKQRRKTCTYAPRKEGREGEGSRGLSSTLELRLPFGKDMKLSPNLDYETVTEVGVV